MYEYLVTFHGCLGATVVKGCGKEIGTIFPGIDLTKRKLNLTPEDFDLFTTHAYSHVLALQKELQRLQTDGELRLKRTIDSMRGDNASDTAEPHTDHLQDVVNMKESELKHQYTRELVNKMATERANYKLQLAAVLGKVRGMDAAMQEINVELEEFFLPYRGRRAYNSCYTKSFSLICNRFSYLSLQIPFQKQK
uniref:MICOS complex subunit MIC60 n=1 Tax=Glossina morsitans morsitans TaxID=37546 RepID=A0A1B0FHD5_GLOMM